MKEQTHARTKIEKQTAITSVPRRLLQRKCACGTHTPSGGGECGSCRRKREGTPLQRAAVSPAPLSEIPPIVGEVLSLTGKPLDAATREYMEPRFGHDFSGVRIHADAKAAESARAVNARAYAVGRDVVFGAGQYQPASSAGRRLMAHELAHVVQQSGAETENAPLTLGEANSPYEKEAHSISERLAQMPDSRNASVLTNRLSNAPTGVVQRIGPVAAGAAGAAVGAALAIVSFNAALDYGKSLATRYPGWLSVLPNCPCTRADVLADPATWGRDANRALSWFHPGAAYSYRSNASYPTLPGTAHGQQCTYDSHDNLITDGPGAGTPDVWSPVTNTAEHILYDAATWQLLGWRIYTRYWTPNNGRGCAANQGDNTLMRRFSEFIP